MKSLIDNMELKHLLEKRKQSIGCKGLEVDTFIAGITFLLSMLGASFQSYLGISGEHIKVLSIVAGIIITICGATKVIKSKISKYDNNQLYEEIVQLNSMEHPFSIIAIKDTFNEFSNRLLVYYDERWKCRLFFSYKTDVEDNEIEKESDFVIDGKHFYWMTIAEMESDPGIREVNSDAVSLVKASIC